MGRSMGSTMRLEGQVCFKRVIMPVDGTIPWPERLVADGCSLRVGPERSHSRLTAPVPLLAGEALVISEHRGALNFSSEKKGTL